MGCKSITKGDSLFSGLANVSIKRNKVGGVRTRSVSFSLAALWQFGGENRMHVVSNV